MLKYVTYPGIDENDNVFVSAIKPAEGLVKTASQELTAEVRNYIDTLKQSPDKVYILVNAMGAGEYYGSNVNGDYFEETELTKTSSAAGYKTFLASGVYRHHRNKDPEKSMGKVKVAAYNDRMRRVELVVEIDREKAASLGHSDLVRQLDDGGNPAVSMGCKVKHDVCSICSHESKTRRDYCKHASAMMNQVLDDGRKVYVTNPNPRFFDISFVVVGADKTSYAMKKVAYAQTALSVDAAQEAGLADPDVGEFLKAGKSKLSDILKRIPAAAEKIDPATTNEPDIPEHVLDGLAKKPLEDVSSSLSSMGVILKPHEYQRIVLVKLGQKTLADRLDRENKVFAPVDGVDRSITMSPYPGSHEKIKEAMLAYMGDRSAFYPLLKNRVLTKVARSNKIPTRTFETSELLDSLSAGYNGYRVELLDKLATVIQNITLGDPDILGVIGEDRFENEFVFSTKVKTSGVFSKGMTTAIAGLLPLTYFYSAYVKKKRGAGLPVGPVDSFIEKHPNFSASMAIGLARMGFLLNAAGTTSRGFETLMGKF
jgi:hypothetical protein